MRIPGVKTAKAVSRWLQARILGGAIILGYHRIAIVSMDEYDVCVTPQHFDEHMDVVRNYAHPIALSQLVQHLKEDTLPAKSVAVTFDDGYADNLYQAKPILEKYQIPATVFVCTGYTGKEFWWDELARLVMASSEDQPAIRLEVRDSLFQWNKPTVHSDAKNLKNVSYRSKLCHSLYHFLLSLDVEEREDAMNVIRDWSSLSSNEHPIQRAMNHAELLELAEGGLVDLGAHTVTHPMLPRLGIERQRQEIVSSKQDLEELSGRPVAGFAYPNGRATDEARRIVKDAGFSYACVSLRDMVRPGCNPYELTRFWQENVDGDKFLQNLNLWMSIQRN